MHPHRPPICGPNAAPTSSLRRRRGWTVAVLLACGAAAALGPPTATAAATNTTAPVAAAPNPHSNTAYLIALGRLGGHLHVVIELCRDGKAKLAAQHLVRLDSALYAELSPDLKQYGRPPMKAQLTRLAKDVDSGAELGVIEGDYATLADQIRLARDAMAHHPRAMFRAMADLTRLAAKDYRQGVVNTQVMNPIAYRNAWGLMQSVRAMADLMVASTVPSVDTAAFQAIEALSRASDAFTGLLPDAPIQADSTLLFQIATKIDTARQALH